MPHRARAAGDPVPVVRALYAAVAAGDLERLLPLFADDVVWDHYGPATIPWAGRYRGRDGIPRFLAAQASHVAVEDFAIGELVADGETVVVLGTQSLRALRTGEACEVHWAHVFHFAGGKIVNVRELVDTAPIAALLARR